MLSEQLLLPRPNLKQRFLGSLFNPLVVVPTVLFIVTVWTSYHILDYSSKTDFSTSTVTTSIITSSTVPTTTVVTTTVVSGLRTSPTLSPGGSISKDSIRNEVDSFLELKVNNSVHAVNQYLSGYYYPTIQQTVENWNKSFYDGLEREKAMLKTVQSYNETIFSNLYQQSQKINTTIDKLSSEGFTVETDNDYTSDLLLNYWFINDLFGNVSNTLANLETVGTQRLPNVTENTGLPLKNITEDFKKDTDVERLIEDLVSNISIIIEENNHLTFESLQKKRDIMKRSEYHRDGRLQRKCSILTAVFAVSYVLAVLVLLAWEWLNYRTESTTFKDLVGSMVDALLVYHDTEDKEFSMKLRFNKEIKPSLWRLGFTSTNSMVYYFTKLQIGIFEKVSPCGSSIRLCIGKWQIFRDRLSIFNWWIIKGGMVLYLLLFGVLIEIQVITSLIKVSSLDLGASTLEKRSTEYTIGFNSSLFHQVDETCTHFEVSINDYLNQTLNFELWDDDSGILYKLSKEVDNNMSEVIGNLEDMSIGAELIPGWNLDGIEFQLPNVTLSNFPETILADVIEKSDTKLELGYAKLKKRDTTNGNSKNALVSSLNALLWRIIVVLMIIILLHHFMGLLIILL